MNGFICFIDNYLILVQDNGQIRSFAELTGEALNFHKPGSIKQEIIFLIRIFFFR
jgi:hypothetical protein